MSEQQTETTSEAPTTMAEAAEVLYPAEGAEKADTDAQPSEEATSTSDDADAAADANAEGAEAAESSDDGEAETAEEGEAEGDAYEPMTVETLPLPEGMELSDARRDSVLDFVNKHQLPAEAVKEFMDLNASWASEDSDKGMEAWSNVQEEWVTAAKADPTIGGDKLDPALASISNLIDATMVDAEGKPDQAAADELRQIFTLTGAGNHPLMIRMLSMAAEAANVQEGKPLQGSRPALTQQTAAAALFPTMAEGK